ncbi:glycosyltransferase family 2 protein [Xanthobacter wiegelii]|uniref:glycosyltransferase family 2 protein n=1 Tax=Xanthobacter wiegelii TaxID=3119913 RepID=UPI00372C9F5E
MLSVPDAIGTAVKYSIVIPCRNRPADLKRAIATCLAQSVTDLEVIVIDDFSTEDVASVCAEFDDPRIRYFRNPVNLGVSKSRNAGIEAARGDFVLFLDSDDEYLPNKMAAVEAALAAHPEAAVFFHAQRWLLSDRQVGTIPGRPPRPGERLDEFILLNGNHCQTNSYIIRRDIALKVRFDENCSLFEDTKFIIECSFAAGGYVFIEDVLSIYDDRNASARLSKMIDETRMTTFMRFVETKCSPVARAGFFALMCGYIDFWRHPQRVTAGLWNGFNSGVGKKRIVLYFLRSAVGAGRINRMLAGLRQ